MYSVYIIYSNKLDRYYIGYTENVEKRLVQHNTGLSDFTVRATDWIIKYQKQYPSRAEAFKAEQIIKN